MSNGVGKSLDDLKTNYTIDQIYLLYEKCLKDELEALRMNALVMAQALVYASPSYDKQSANKKHRAWTKFVNSLDWSKLQRRDEKPDPTKLAMGFQRLGIPVFKKKKEVK